MFILMRMSFTHQEATYVSTVAVVMNELSKMVASFVLLVVQHNGDLFQVFSELYKELVVNWKDTILTAVPALLYTVQTNLIYVGGANLPSATLHITNQLKILTTAFFSVVLLGREISRMQWFALVLLMCGVAIFHSKSSSDDAEAESSPAEEGGGGNSVGDGVGGGGDALGGREIASEIAKESYMDTTIPSVFIQFEVLDGICPPLFKVSLSCSNAGFSLVFASTAVYSKDYEQVAEGGLLQGFTPIVWSLIMFQSCGGLLVAAVTKYLDSIIKNYAGALAVSVTGAISIFYLHESSISSQFLLGTGLVVTSSFLYGSKLSFADCLGGVDAAASALPDVDQVQTKA
eukprot:gene371-34369_t